MLRHIFLKSFSIVGIVLINHFSFYQLVNVNSFSLPSRVLKILTLCKWASKVFALTKFAKNSSVIERNKHDAEKEVFELNNTNVFFVIWNKATKWVR